MEGLIVVDVQNDFCAGGALAVPEGDEVVEPINRLAELFPFVVATREWHPPDHHSFEEQGGPWPDHCVRETGGAELHPKLHTSAIPAVVDAVRLHGHEVYSWFEHSGLDRMQRGT